MQADLILHHHRRMMHHSNRQFFASRRGEGVAGELARVGREISLAYARCVNDALLAANLERQGICGGGGAWPDAFPSAA